MNDAEPLSAAQYKRLTTLLQKKGRREAGAFLAPGYKLVTEAIGAGLRLRALVATDAFARKHSEIYAWPARRYRTTDARLAKLAALDAPEGIVAEVELPEPPQLAPDLPGGALWLYRVQDPGNLGALLRVADWFGFPHVFATPDCADVFNAKTLRAGMGAAFRVPVYYTEDFAARLSRYGDRVAAAVMDGPPPEDGYLRGRDMLLLGNESQGLPEALWREAGAAPVSIPRLGGAESLNVAVAGGVLAYAMRCG